MDYGCGCDQPGQGLMRVLTHSHDAHSWECKPYTECIDGQYEVSKPAQLSSGMQVDRICANLTVCEEDNEYESTAPNATQNRVCFTIGNSDDCGSRLYLALNGQCEQFAVCTDGEYESTAPTSEQNRVCTIWTQCTDDEYESTAPAATQNRNCTTLTQCEDGEYESTAPAATQNRVCTNLTQCTDYQYETTAPDATQNRACTTLTQCTDYQYELTAPNATQNRVCTTLTQCEDGEYESTAPNATQNRVCKTKETKCWGSGSYYLERFVSNGTTYSYGECLLYTVCADDEYETTAAFAYTDRVCTKTTVCEDGEYESTAPSDPSAKGAYAFDRVCKTKETVADCDSHSYLAGTGQCLPWTVCTDDEYESTAPSDTQNRACTTLTQCTDDQYESTAPAATQNRVCTNLTQCTYGEYVSTAPSATQNRVCTIWTVCADYQYESTQIQPTLAQNRVCNHKETVADCDSHSYLAGTGQCLPWTVCKDDEFVATAPSVTQNRVCKTKETVGGCDSHSYLERFVSNGTTYSYGECRKSLECPDGQYRNSFEYWHALEYGSTLTLYFDRNQYYNSIVGCEKQTLADCESMRYSLDRNFSEYYLTENGECVYWGHPCGHYEYELTAPTATQRRVCKLKETTHSCYVKGDFYLEPFVDQGRTLNYGECLPWTVCTELEYEATAPSITQDRVCRCGNYKTDDEEWHNYTRDCDGVCGGSAVEYGCGCNQPGQGNYRKRDFDLNGIWTGLCLPYTECTDVEYESTAPTSDQNRVCSCGNYYALETYEWLNYTRGCDDECHRSPKVRDCAGVCGGDNVDLGCGCSVAGPSGCDNQCGSTKTEDCAGVCGGSKSRGTDPDDGACCHDWEKDCRGNCVSERQWLGQEDLGCGCDQPGPSGCDNVCGSVTGLDCNNDCGGTNSSCEFNSCPNRDCWGYDSDGNPADDPCSSPGAEKYDSCNEIFNTALTRLENNENPGNEMDGDCMQAYTCQCASSDARWSNFGLPCESIANAMGGGGGGDDEGGGGGTDCPFDGAPDVCCNSDDSTALPLFMNGGTATDLTPECCEAIGPMMGEVLACSDSSGETDGTDGGSGGGETDGTDEGGGGGDDEGGGGGTDCPFDGAPDVCCNSDDSTALPLFMNGGTATDLTPECCEAIGPMMGEVLACSDSSGETDGTDGGSGDGETDGTDGDSGDGETDGTDGDSGCVNIACPLGFIIRDTLSTGITPSAKQCCRPRHWGCRNMTFDTYDPSAGVHSDSFCFNHVDSLYGNYELVDDTTYLEKRAIYKKMARVKYYLEKNNKTPKAAVRAARVEVLDSVMNQRVKDRKRGTVKLALAVHHVFIDSCELGADDDNCASLDLAEDRVDNETTILLTDDNGGSWAVVADGSDIIVKQTRIDSTSFYMQCWNGTSWGEAEVKAASTESHVVTHRCGTKVFMIGSLQLACDDNCGYGTSCSESTGLCESTLITECNDDTACNHNDQTCGNQASGATRLTGASTTDEGTCAACANGTWAATDAANCLAHKTCVHADGKAIGTAGTLEADTVCCASADNDAICDDVDKCFINGCTPKQLTDAYATLKAGSDCKNSRRAQDHTKVFKTCYTMGCTTESQMQAMVDKFGTCSAQD